jgi:hypothetical protein
MASAYRKRKRASSGGRTRNGKVVVATDTDHAICAVTGALYTIVTISSPLKPSNRNNHDHVFKDPERPQLYRQHNGNCSSHRSHRAFTNTLKVTMSGTLFTTTEIQMAASSRSTLTIRKYFPDNAGTKMRSRNFGASVPESSERVIHMISS